MQKQLVALWVLVGQNVKDLAEAQKQVCRVCVCVCVYVYVCVCVCVYMSSCVWI